MNESIRVTDDILLRIWDGIIYLTVGAEVTAIDDVDVLKRALGRAGLIAEEQVQMAAQYAGTCNALMIHPDKSEATCVLPKAHRLDDSDHRDVHGHRAPVLVHQSTIREVKALQDARDAGLIE